MSGTVLGCKLSSGIEGFWLWMLILSRLCSAVVFSTLLCVRSERIRAIPSERPPPGSKVSIYSPNECISKRMLHCILCVILL